MAATIPTKIEPSKVREFSGIFTALVESSDPSTFNCVICPTNTVSISQPRMQGISLSHCFASLFGFRASDFPEPGASVVCYQIEPKTAWILGTIPAVDKGTLVNPSRVLSGQGDSIIDAANLQGYGKDLSKIVFNNSRRPTDTVQGEHVLSNDFGMVMGLFQQMAMLKASDLAQIQVYLLDDLVRIISHNFQHWTSSGEYSVYHDGKALISEYTATHIPQETYGNPIRTSDDSTQPFTDTGESEANDLKDLYALANNERAKAIERIKIYTGRLGDFINAFIAIPNATTLPDLAGTKPTTPDLGALNLHVGTDGSFGIRSIKEIFLEKTNWIRVPQRILTPEDPTGDDAGSITYPVKKEFKFNDNYKVNDNPFLYFLQLRDYVAYESQVNNYLNLAQHPKDFYLNSDLSKESSLSSIGSVDPQTPANNQANYQLRTSGFYLMENGGFVIRDAWGSAIISEGGNIYIQPAKNLYLQPLGSLVGKVGQFVSIAANNDIDLSSTTGGVRVKSELAQFYYSDSSGIVLQSNGKNPSSGIPTTDAVKTVGGIVLKSNLGIYNYATTDILQYATNNLVLKSDNLLQEQAPLVTISSTNSISIAAQTSLGLYSIGSVIVASEGFCGVGGAGSTAFGQKDQWLGLEYIPNDEFVDPIKGSLDIVTLAAPANNLISTDTLKTIDSFQNKDQFKNLTFKFLDTKHYGITIQTDPIPQTIAQQQDLFVNSGTLSAWKEKPVSSTYPYPGATLFDSIYAASTGLNNFQKYPNSSDLAEIANGQSQATAISNKSLQTYTIINQPET